MLRGLGASVSTLLPAGLAYALAGCSSGSGETREAGAGGAMDGGDAGVVVCPESADGGPTYAPTYCGVYNEILNPTCALVFCHGGTLDFLSITSKDEGYQVLVNAQGQGPNCSAYKRVDPGHPENSLLYLKVTNPPCGSKMPLIYTGLSGNLDPRQIEQIKGWIEAGAPNN